MSNFSASIPASEMQAANDLLNNTAQTPGKKSHGPNNFSVPSYAGPSPSVALLHAWGDPVFEAAVASIAGVTITQGTDPIEMTSEAAAAAGSTWGNDALPLTGTVTPGLYKDEDGVLWWVIQTYDTAVYPEPILIPALIRMAKIPGEALPWVQPIDQYDAYKLVNPFTGEGDYSTHKGSKWQVTAADGSGNNVWEPGVFGWSSIGPDTNITTDLDGDGFLDVVRFDNGRIKVTEDANSFDIDLDGDGDADISIPKATP